MSDPITLLGQIARRVVASSRYNNFHPLTGILFVRLLHLQQYPDRNMNWSVSNIVNRATLIIAFAIVSMVGQSVSATSIRVISGSQHSAECFRGGVAEVVNMVDRAITLMEKKGLDAAFKQMMNPAGGFIKGDLYVFVLDPNGTLVVNSAAPESVGNNALNARDQNGRYFIREMLQKAFAHGAGWINYHWYSPCTGKMALKQTFFRKSGYFVVGVGFYDNLGI